MNKKEYKKPSVKAVKLDSAVTILAGSDPEPKSLPLFDEEVDPEYESYGQF